MGRGLEPPTKFSKREDLTLRIWAWTVRKFKGGLGKKEWGAVFEGGGGWGGVGWGWGRWVDTPMYTMAVPTMES